MKGMKNMKALVLFMVFMIFMVCICLATQLGVTPPSSSS